MVGHFQKFLIGTAGICLALFLPGVAIATSSSGATDGKPAVESASPHTIAAAVESQKVDADLARTIVSGRSASALITVSYADTIPPPAEKDSAGALSADSRKYARRKSDALRVGGSGTVELRDFPAFPVMLVRVDSAAALGRLVASEDVVSVEPNRSNRADLAQSLPLIRQPQVAAAGHTGQGTSVAVLDTGVDFHRAAFGSCTEAGEEGCAVAYAHDFAPDDGSLDDNGHGTNVAGIAVGVAPSTKILALDVFGSGGGATDGDIIAAIEWAIDHQGAYNIRALNLSLGVIGSRYASECTSSSYAAPFLLARSVNILPVVAAGNAAYVNGTYQDGVSAPACAPGAVRVGAVYDSNLGSRSWGSSPYACADPTTAADKITCFSQSGSLLSLLAPGSEITAAGITESGTSQATPHVAGAVAVLAAVKPNASPFKVEQSLESSGPVIKDPRNDVSRHRLDLVDAVENMEKPDAVLEDVGCTQNVLPANDDESTAAVALPFAVDFFGAEYGETYVNNNGNVTFEAPLSTYTPFTISSSVPPIIAPFFADVDTRGLASSLVTYGSTTYGGRPAFCVNWADVGYYSGHTDKTNSFQLLLVDRSNIGAGDFDIIMNYDHIAWETGDASGGAGGFGGTPAAAGYSAGDGEAAHFFSFPGSISAGAFLDVNPGGLVHGSRESQQAGRYIFPIRNGLAPGSAGLTGLVTGPGGIPLNRAPVQACMIEGHCVTTRSGSDGRYQLSALPPGDFEVSAFPPSESSLIPAGPIAAHLFDGVVSTVDLELTGPSGPPPGTTITNRGTTGEGVPIVYWNEPLTLQTNACSGGAVSYRITVDGEIVRSGTMAESPAGSGHYAAVVAALYPNHGNAVTVIESSCPNPAEDEEVRFDLYIDPSGTVVDTHGTPLAGATVTLLRSDTSEGPFEPVAEGDPTMSPANRVNPDTTAADGSFGWDVIAGYYKVRAEDAGCVSAADPGVAYAESGVLTIPPAVTGLTLILDCADRLSVIRDGNGSGTVSSLPAGILCGAACAHDFPNGAQVELTATPAAGSTFVGWSGGGCSGTAPCHLTLASDTSVTATFGTAGSSPPGGVGLDLRGVPGPTSTRRPLKCRKGFKRRKVNGKARCVKVKKRHRRRHHRAVER